MTNEDPRELLKRLEQKDPTLWPEGNVSQNRLGWLDVVKTLSKEAKELRKWADTIDQDTIVLLGMGGSSLGPLVLGEVAKSFNSPTGRKLVVCDTTDPTTVASMPYEDAFMLVSSKSGTTLEPNVLFSYARSRVSDPKRYAVVTDPGSQVAKLGDELGINRVFNNQSDIGGRYSVLSYFGLVPAVLLGYEIDSLCDAAMSIDRLQAVELGVAMGEAALAGQNKATIVVSPPHRSFGLWVEQLIAESTGKHDIGVVPVPTSDNEEGEDRHLIPVSFSNAYEVGGEFFRFEIATAIAGHVLKIDPFDEPNVAESKANTNRVLSELPLPVEKTAEPGELEEFLDTNLHEGDYISIQAYLPFGVDAELEALRVRVRDQNGGVAVTAGYGPRFLHSTGQLHKGGPDSIVALQIVPRSARPELPIPGYPYDFATLIAAQSIGDYESLVSHKRRVLRIVLDDLGELAP